MSQMNNVPRGITGSFATCSGLCWLESMHHCIESQGTHREGSYQTPAIALTGSLTC